MKQESRTGKGNWLVPIPGRSLRIFVALAAMAAALTGCPVFTGSSSDNNPPVANAGPNQVVRSQEAVTLSGRDSEDPDGVIQSFQWTQVSGPSVVLTKITNSTVKFTVPQLFTATTLAFELTVTDDKGATGTQRVSIQVEPPADPNRFLTFLDVPGSFKVVAATAAAQSAAAAGHAFTVDVATRIDYTVYADGVPAARSKTYHQTASGSWPSTGSGGESKDDYRNPWLTFNLPKVSLDDLRNNLAAGEILFGTERNALQVTVSATLSSDLATHMYVLDQSGNLLGEQAGSPDAALSFSSSDRTLNNLYEQKTLGGSAVLDDVESERTAKAYYAAIDPDNKRDTLSKWKKESGFVDGDPTIVEATYINGFDLGFARHMYARKDDNGNVYIYVINAPTLEAAQSNVNTIATVVMEYSPAPGALASDLNKYTKFYTFVLNPLTGEQDRVLTMDFDGRGEKYHPGTCAACHGGKPAQFNAGSYPKIGDIGAGFLPWDVNSFYFSDTDFDRRVRNVGPTAAQSEAFRRFNEMVLLTKPSAAVKELVHGWYGSTDLTATSLPANASFNPDFIPAGWLPGNTGGPADNQAAEAATLYKKVVGPFCRACHAQRSDNTDISFDAYEKFVDENDAGKIADLVFDRGVMPLAAHTMDDFWLNGSPSSAAAVLASHFGIAATRVPGIPIASIGRAVVNGANVNVTGGAITVDRINGTAMVRMNADASLFANTWQWQLITPDGSSAFLVGDTTRDAAFRADRPGTYTVQLVVSNGVTDSAAATLDVNVTNNAPTAAADAAATVMNSPVTTSVLANDQLGDQPSAITAKINGAHGTVSINAGAGTTIYTPNSGYSGSDSYTYTITDVDGQTSTATVNVTVTPLPVAVNDSSTTTANTIKSITVIGNDSLGVTPTTVTAKTNGDHGTVVITNAGTGVLTYTPAAYYIGSDSFTYTITDANNQSSTATVNVTVNPNSGTTFSSIDANILVPCMSCHAHSFTNYNTTLPSTTSDKNSPLLVKPASPSPGHSGGVQPGFGDTGAQSSDCIATTDSSTNSSDTSNCGNYNKVLEWIRESAPNN